MKRKYRRRRNERRLYSSEVLEQRRVLDGDDFGNDAATAQAVQVPLDLSGELETTEDVDWFQFPVEAGDSYHVSASPAERIRWYASDGETLLDEASGRHDLVIHVAEPQTVFVEVADPVNPRDYRLQVRRIADDHGNTPETATDLAAGVELGGLLEVDGERDLFRIEVQAGLEYLALFEGCCYDARLLASDGLTELDRTSLVSRHLKWAAADDAPMYLEVQTERSQIEFTLIYDELSTLDPHGDSLQQATAIEPNTTINSRIESEDDADWFAVDVVLGNSYGFAINGTDTMRLYDAQGDLIASQGVHDTITYEALASSNVFVEVTNRGRVDYQLHVTTFDDDHGSRPTTATALEVGTELAGNVDFIHEPDWFEFQATQDVSYFIQTEGAWIDLSVWDAERQLIQGDSSLQPTVVVTAAETGTMRIQVLGNELAAYQLRVDKLSDIDTDGDTIETATPITVDGPTTTTARLDYQADVDWFSFVAEASQSYDFGLFGALRLTVASADGTIIGRVDGNNASFVYETIEATTLLIGVEGYWRNAPYELTIDPFEDDHGNQAATSTPLRFDRLTSGVIERTDDVDWFSLSAVAGNVYLIETVDDSLAQIRLADGQSDVQVISEETRTPGHIEWVSEVDQTVYLVASYRQPSSYRLRTVDVTSSDDHGNTINDATLAMFGQTNRGRLDSPGDEDFFAVDVQAGSAIAMSAEGAANLELLSADGETRLAYGSYGENLVFGPQRTETLFARVSGRANSFVPEYQLHLVAFDDDHGNSAATATPITVGVPEQVEFEVANDVDWLSFPVTAGEHYIVQSSTPIILLDELGQTPLAGGLSGERELLWTATESTTLTISVPYRFTSGVQTVSVFNYEDLDQHANELASATPLSFSQTLGGRLEIPSDVDWFSFDAAPGNGYRLRVTGTDHVELFDKDGNPVVHYASNTNYMVDVAETQRLYVSIADGNRPRDYQITVTPYADDHGNQAASATLVTIGEARSVEFEVQGDVDWFALELTGGITYVNQARPTMSLEVYAPDGVTPIVPQTNVLDWTPAEDGTYYVAVVALHGSDAQFKIDAFQLIDDHGETPASATPVSLDGEKAGVIESRVDRDWFAIRVQSGTSYNFLTPDDHVSRLIASDGQTVLVDSGLGRSFVWNAQQSAEIYFEVAADSNRGDYTWTVSSFRDDFGNHAAAASPLALNGTTLVTSDVEGDVDWLYFDAERNTDYVFSSDSTLTRLRVIDENGVSVLRETRGQPIRWTAPYDGRFYVSVSDSQVGLPLRLIAGEVDVLDTHQATIERATPIEVGKTVEGRIDVPADHDWFRLDVLAGTTYAARLDGEGTLSLLDDAGQRIASDSSRLSFEATRNGFVLLDVFHNSGVSDYELSVSEVADDHGGTAATATSLNLETPIQGAIQVAGEEDWFRIQADANEIYLFRTDGDVAVSVADEQGQILASLGTDLVHAWRAPSAGVYHVALHAFEPTDYELSVVLASSIDDHANDRENATAIVSGTVGTGSFEYEFDIDWLSIELEAGASYSFDLTNVWSASLQAGANSEVVQLRHDRFTGYSFDDATWYLRLEGGSSNRAYSVWTSRYQDDHAGAATGATPIGLDQILSGRIEVAGDEDWFRFDAVAGVTYQASAIPAQVSLAFFDASHREVAGSLGGTGTRTWTAPASESIYLRVASSLPQDYSIKLADLSLQDEHGDIREEATPIQLGSEVHSRIDRVGDVDWLQVDAVAGESYAVSLDHPARLRVVDASQNTLAVLDASQRPVTFEAPADGPIFFKVEASQPLDYTLRLSRYHDDFASRIATAQPIAATSVTNGIIEMPGDADWFRFDAIVGETYIVEAPGYDLSVRVVDANNGSELTRIVSGGRVAWTATSDLNAIVQVSSASIRNYTLSVATLSEIDAHDNDYEQATLMALGERVEAVLEADVDEDWFAFAVESGVSYTIQTTGMSQGDAQIAVFADDGVTQLAELTTLHETLILTADSDGTWYFRLSQGSDVLFRYAIEVAVDEFPNSRDEAPVVLTPTDIDGQLNAGESDDWLAFEVIKDTRYVIRLTPTEQSELLRLFLEDDLGERLAEAHVNRVGEQAAIVWTADENRTMYLQINGFDWADAIPYRLQIEAVDDHADHAVGAAPVLEDFPRSGTITRDDDTDWFRFEATVGTAYTFSHSLLELAESKLELFDEDGITLIDTVDVLNSLPGGASDDTRASLTWLAPRDQVVYARVSTAAPEARGRYHLAVDRAFGDVNLDGEFGTADLVQIFARGEYEDDIEGNSTWADGDWNGDGEFDSQDLVIALQARGWRG